MFTGIIEHQGRVTRVSPERGLTVLRLLAEPPFERVERGESVAVDGVCLTVTEVAGAQLTFEVVPETLSRSTLGRLRAGEAVNLERSLRLGELVGGHLILGHVDGVGHISALRPVGGQVELVVEVPAELTREMLPKGSVAVDGVSLTLIAVEAERFSVALIPYTLKHTGFGRKKLGDLVNVETDYLGKWVLRALAQLGEPSRPETVTRELLQRTGFLRGAGGGGGGAESGQG